MTGLAAAEVSFRRTEMLQELAGLRVETKQVERTAKALGAEVAERAAAVQPPVSTLYLGMDGTGVPVRPSECEGRPGKQPDGSQRPARSNWCLSGRPPHSATRRAVPSTTPLGFLLRRHRACSATGDTDPEPSAFAQRVDRKRDAGASPRLNGA